MGLPNNFKNYNTWAAKASGHYTRANPTPCGKPKNKCECSSKTKTSHSGNDGTNTEMIPRKDIENREDRIEKYTPSIISNIFSSKEYTIIFGLSILLILTYISKN